MELLKDEKHGNVGLRIGYPIRDGHLKVAKKSGKKCLFNIQNQPISSKETEKTYGEMRLAEGSTCRKPTFPKKERGMEGRSAQRQAASNLDATANADDNFRVLDLINRDGSLTLESLPENLGFQHTKDNIPSEEEGKFEVKKITIDKVSPCKPEPLWKRKRNHPITMVTCNAARERTRSEKVKTLRSAFTELQQALPCVPPDTKLSKLDVLVLASMYIAHLMNTLHETDHYQPCHHCCPAGGGQHSGGGTPGGNCCLGESGANKHHLEYMHPVKKWPMRTRLYTGLAAWARGAPYPATVTNQSSESQDHDVVAKTYTYL